MNGMVDLVAEHGSIHKNERILKHVRLSHVRHRSGMMRKDIIPLCAAIDRARTEHKRFMLRDLATPTSPCCKHAKYTSNSKTGNRYPAHRFPITVEEMQGCKRVLMSHFLFACLQERVLDLVVSSVLRKIVPKVGSILFRRTAPESFYILLKGKIQIWNRNRSSVISETWSTFGRWSAGDGRDWSGSSAKVTGWQKSAVLFVLEAPALAKLNESMGDILRVYSNQQFSGDACSTSLSHRSQYLHDPGHLSNSALLHTSMAPCFAFQKGDIILQRQTRADFIPDTQHFVFCILEGAVTVKSLKKNGNTMAELGQGTTFKSGNNSRWPPPHSVVATQHTICYIFPADAPTSFLLPELGHSSSSDNEEDWHALVSNWDTTTSLSMRDLEVVDTIGQGTMATVLRVKFPDGGGVFALKVLSKDSVDSVLGGLEKVSGGGGGGGGGVCVGGVSGGGGDWRALTWCLRSQASTTQPAEARRKLSYEENGRL